MNIAIVGATGLVGQTVLQILGEKNMLSGNNIFLFATEKSNGKILKYKNFEFAVRTLCIENLQTHFDFAIFSAGSNVSKVWAKKFVQKGAVVIDNSSAFRRMKNVPLVVPEINFDDISSKTKIIANPNCSTIGLSLPIFAISCVKKINRIIVSTYQAASGAGNSGILDLENKTKNKFPYVLTDNLIPQIDKFLPSGYSFEEDKLMFELNKILHSDIKISATAVRVPISNCHSESVNIELEKSCSKKAFVSCFEDTSGITLIDDLSKNLYPMPIFAQKTDNILVGRIRKDKSQKNCYNMFLCMNNIRKGAALNAVQILEKYIQKFL